jgi:phage terminase small subunit
MSPLVMNTQRQLDARESRFVSAYLIDLDPRRAAIEAGYAESVANSKSYSWVGNSRVKPHVFEAIAEAKAKRSQRTEITQDRVLQELARIGFFDVRRAFTAEGTIRPLDELDDDTAAALVVEASQSTDGEGCTSYTRRIKFADKLRALELIGKHLGMFRDRLEVSGDAQNPLLLLIKRIQTAGSSIKPVKEGNDEEYDRAA